MLSSHQCRQESSSRYSRLCSHLCLHFSRTYYVDCWMFQQMWHLLRFSQSLSLVSQRAPLWEHFVVAFCLIWVFVQRTYNWLIFTCLTHVKNIPRNVLLIRPIVDNLESLLTFNFVRIVFWTIRLHILCNLLCISDNAFQVYLNLTKFYIWFNMYHFGLYYFLCVSLSFTI